MAAFLRFSEDVSEEELNAFIQKAIPEKIKNKQQKNMVKKISKVREKKEFEVSI